MASALTPSTTSLGAVSPSKGPTLGQWALANGSRGASLRLQQQYLQPRRIRNADVHQQTARRTWLAHCSMFMLQPVQQPLQERPQQSGRAAAVFAQQQHQVEAATAPAPLLALLACAVAAAAAARQQQHPTSAAGAVAVGAVDNVDSKLLEQQIQQQAHLWRTGTDKQAHKHRQQQGGRQPGTRLLVWLLAGAAVCHAFFASSFGWLGLGGGPRQGLLQPPAAVAVTAAIRIPRQAAPVEAEKEESSVQASLVKAWGKFLYHVDVALAVDPSYKMSILAAVCAVMTLIGGVIYFQSCRAAAAKAAAAAEDEGSGEEGEDDEEGEVGLGEACWQAWSLLIDPGKQHEQDTGVKRILAIVLTAAGLLVFATLVNVVCEAAENKLDDLRQGRVPVVETGHTLIVGWNNKTVPLVRQLMEAHEHRAAVVLAEEEKEAMDEELRSAFSREDRKKFRIVTRSGTPFSSSDLANCSARTASSIVVLPPAGAPADAADEYVLHASLALASRPDISANIVADLSAEQSVRLLESLHSTLLAPPSQPPLGPGTGTTSSTTSSSSASSTSTSNKSAADAPAAPAAASAAPSQQPKQQAQSSKAGKVHQRRMVPLATGDVALRALLGWATDAGRESVLDDLLDFYGNEFRLKEWPELTGQTFGDALFRFDAAIPCGVLKAPSSASSSLSWKLLINPPSDTLIQEGDELLVISEDPDSYDVGPSRRSVAAASAPSSTTTTATSSSREVSPSSRRGGNPNATLEMPRRNVLVCWWRADAESMLAQLKELCGEGSKLTVVSSEPLTRHERKDLQARGKALGLPITVVERDCSSADTWDSVRVETFDTVMVLRPPDTAGPLTDATTTAMLVKSKQIARGQTGATVVAEVSFGEQQEDAKQTIRKVSVDATIVPEAVQAQVLANVAINADVGKVIDSVLGSQRAGIVPRSAARYAADGEELSFWELQERAMALREIVVAHRCAAAGGKWALNPTQKDDKLKWTPQDEVLVIVSKQGEDVAA